MLKVKCDKYNKNKMLVAVLQVLTVSPQKFLLLEVLQAVENRECTIKNCRMIRSQNQNKIIDTQMRWMRSEGPGLEIIKAFTCCYLLGKQLMAPVKLLF